MQTSKNEHLLDRPREKLLSKGAESLTDQELLAVMLGRGIKNKPVMSLAREILRHLDRMPVGSDKHFMELKNVAGFGDARITALRASLEFARRRIQPKGFLIRKSADLIPLVRYYADRKQEHFICITLNGALEVIASRVITIGLVNETQVHPREVFADAITDRATNVILAHNHPTGSLEPSDDDVRVTLRLREVGEMLGIPVLDHVIFNLESHVSLKDLGVIP